MFHKPILVDAFLSFFKEKAIQTFLDGTLGAGGHAEKILEAHPEIERFYGLDQDLTALKIAQERLKPYASKITLIHGNFRLMDKLLPDTKFDGIFLDIGVSSMQLDQAEKGFSFTKEGPLDMRMDATQELDAKRVVNTYSEKELGEIFRDLGEERKWRAAAKAIVEVRKKRQIQTTKDFTEALKFVLPRRGKIHPMTRVFQALRIFVNDELGAIKEALPKAVELLAEGGKLGVISFHSLEDRIVKHTFQHLERKEQIVQILTKKPVQPERQETRENPRSRSAKMRFVQKIGSSRCKLGF